MRLPRLARPARARLPHPSRLSASALALIPSVWLLGCAVAPDGADENGADVDETKVDAELTSNTALARTLTFQGKVYVSTTAGDATILAAVRKQTQSAFGALREANVGVHSRELKDVDPKTFSKRAVSVFDASTGKAAGNAVEVTYTYTDDALVPKSMARRSSLSLGLLNGAYESQSSRILKECTSNDAHAQEFESSIWYVFDPSGAACKKAMNAEQAAIDTARAKLAAPKTQITTTEQSRLYLPMTVSLGADKTNKGQSWPEYDRLWSGGVKKGTLVIGMVSGLMADWAAGEKHDTIDDEGYDMWLSGLRVILKSRGFKLTTIEGGTDLTRFTVGTRTVTAAGFDDLLKWELDAVFPAGITTAADKRALRVAVANRLLKRFVTFEAPVSVSIGGAPATNVTVQLNTYFGAETDSAPHKRAIKNSDVFIYNGHSYIGYGPLDPSRFSSSDFPASYQIMFVNGCVSYNYYEKDYVPLKPGGTRNLDLVTNGLESWVNGSGPGVARFVAALIDGKQQSWSSLLKAAEFAPGAYAWGNDALRVVDGELDNVYAPSAKPIVVTAR
jgi:hypothetical protein